MGKSTILPLLFVGGVFAALFVIWQRRQAIAAAKSVQPSGYVAVANTVNERVDTALEKTKLDFLKSAITDPVRNVTTGDYTSMLGSAMTGGLSDWSGKLNPLGWF
jgi:hypothetical protein